jgi:hypothetical protein
LDEGWIVFKGLACGAGVRPRKRSTPPADEAERSMSSSEDSAGRWGLGPHLEGSRSSTDSTAEHADALSCMTLDASAEVLLACFS